MDGSCFLSHASCLFTSAGRAFSSPLPATRVCVRAPGPRPLGTALVWAVPAGWPAGICRRKATRPRCCESVGTSPEGLALHSPLGAKSEGGTPSRNKEARGLPSQGGSRSRRAVSLPGLASPSGLPPGLAFRLLLFHPSYVPAES